MKFVAVCACPAGLMHTFMASKGLKKEMTKAGDEIKIETQSASGIENELTLEDVAQADAVILAIDTAIQGMERFNGKKIVQVSTTQVLKNTKGVIAQAKSLVKGE
ncbi:PTS system fructose-like EIIB component 1 [bioreactor metagenome]|uniref:PTS system fructose-like transporter subunit EIIB n=2 Tax=root TaxID=1 RepID=R9CBU4_9CLOT|nr:fructose PTS transporter subunit IIB [Clostridium sartagoforme]EOR26490.1 PTS system fructose-like transporter subunit EIIB [Clostridium sartagoforme AAU1]